MVIINDHFEGYVKNGSETAGVTSRRPQTWWLHCYPSLGRIACAMSSGTSFRSLCTAIGPPWRIARVTVSKTAGQTSRYRLQTRQA